MRKTMKWIRRGLKEKKAALNAGLDPRTLRKYLLFGKITSQVPRPPGSWRTRPDPFEAADLAWVYGVLKDAPELEVATLCCVARPEARFVARWLAGTHVISRSRAGRRCGSGPGARRRLRLLPGDVLAQARQPTVGG